MNDNINNNENIQAVSFKEKCANNAYYIVIAILSLLALTFLPLLGSTVGMELSIPTTTAGWIVYVVTKLIVCVLNMMIFHSFVKQAKINIRNNTNFKKAEEILAHNKPKDYEPRSPHKFLGQIYGKKGVTVFISSVLSVVALGQALLTFDFASFLSYLLTIIMGCVFGFLTMKNNELYWITEYLDYAHKIEIENENDKKEKEEKLLYDNLSYDSICKSSNRPRLDTVIYLGNKLKENKEIKHGI